MNRLSLLSQQISQNKTSQFSKLLTEKKNSIGYIILNSPKQLNALSEQMFADIEKALNMFNRDPEVNVIVIRSQLEKIFCAGADIKRFTQVDWTVYPNNEIFTSIEYAFKKVKKPIIAAVNGRALGGGFQLALLCDIILCSESAMFGLPEINLGLIPGIGGTQRLPRIVGEKVAMRMILTGEVINAKEAHRLNIAHLLPNEVFYEGVDRIACTIASKAMSTAIVAKKSIKMVEETTLDQGLEYERSHFYSLFNGKASKEGISAFIAKKKPNFKGM